MKIVIKVGTNVLTGNSEIPRLKKIQAILADIANLRTKGYEVILVSSGAVGFGRHEVPGLDILNKKQIWAAVGQPALMHAYSLKAKLFSIKVAQCLVLKDDFTDRERYENFVHTVEGLLATGILPVINENDVVAMSDLTVGDNDLLAAMVAVALQAERLVIFTNQQGLFTANPDTHPEAKLIEIIENVDMALENMVSAETSSFGRGGMLSKIRAAKHAVHAGIATIITDGRPDYQLTEIFIKKRAVGTFFKPYIRKQEWARSQRWLMAAKGLGQIVVDGGAVKALHAGKSLLLPGVVRVKGAFGKQEVVEIIGTDGSGIAYGKVNYSAEDLQQAMNRRKNAENKSVTLEKEVIHRDYMVVLKGA